MSTPDDRYRTHLHAQADQVHIADGDVHQVVALGERRRRRARLGGGLAAAAALTVAGATGAVIWNQIQDEPEAVSLDVGAPDLAALGNGTAARVGVAPAALALADGDLAWTEAEAATGGVSVYHQLVTGSDGRLYALSTAPGEVGTDADEFDENGEWIPPQQAVYRTNADGAWEHTVLGDDLTLFNLAERDGRLYAVGTAAATAAIDPAVGVGDVVVATSDDGGQTWSNTVLPVDLRGLRTVADGVGVGETRLVAGPSGVIATVGTFAFVDLEGRGADDLISNGHGWQFTDVGVEFHGPSTDLAAIAPVVCGDGWSLVPAQPGEIPPHWEEEIQFIEEGDVPAFFACEPGEAGGERYLVEEWALPTVVVGSRTYAELGIDPVVVGALNGATRDFVSTDGISFTEVTLPGGTSGPGVWVDRQIWSLSDGFLLRTATSVEPQVARVAFEEEVVPQTVVELWRSADGVEWTPLSTDGLGTMDAWVMAAGEVGGRVAVVQQGFEGAELAFLDEGGWSTRSLLEGIEGNGGQLNVDQVAIGGGRVVAVATEWVDPLAGFVATVEQDGFTLTIDTDGTSTVVDGTGAVVAQTPAHEERTDADFDSDRPGVHDVYDEDTGTSRFVAVGADGTVIATFPAEAIWNQFDEAYQAADAAGITQPTWLVVSDGTETSATPLADITGELRSAWVVSLVIQDNRAIVTVDYGTGEYVELDVSDEERAAMEADGLPAEAFRQEVRAQTIVTAELG